MLCIRANDERAHLEDAALADLLQIEHLHSSFGAGDHDGTLQAGVEADHGWRRGEGDGREWAEVADVVQLEIGIRKRQSLPVRASASGWFAGLAQRERNAPHRVADRDDVVPLRLDLADPSGVRENALLHRHLRTSGVKENERAGHSRSDELSCTPEVENGDWSRLLNVASLVCAGKGRGIRERTLRTMEPRFTLTTNMSLPGPVAMISEIGRASCRERVS